MSTVGDEQESQQAILETYKEIQPSKDTVSKLIKRVRLLTLELLPVQVAPDDLTEITSRVITPKVVAAYTAAAGDFIEALPYALLRAKKAFEWDANHSPADYDENFGRAMACEVLARRIIHQAPRERLTFMMTNRYSSFEWDGDESDVVSALEIAGDTHCTVFLSSNEAQDVVNSIWVGDLVTRRKHKNHMDFVPCKEVTGGTKRFIDPSRMSVPRYQNMFRILVWLGFLGVYSQAVQEPLDRMNPEHTRLDISEIIMYVLALAFAFENVNKLWKLLHFVSASSFTVWLLVSFLTDALFVTAFSLRMFGLWAQPNEDAWQRLRAFQVLSFASPLIWMKLITVFDGYKYVGTMQICIARMMRESGIFFALLSILGIGFAQGLYALDAADEQAQMGEMVHMLIQALLQSPNYDYFKQSAPGLYLYYLWNVATAVILLNVLVSLFSSAYEDVIEDAEAEYLAFFAAKTAELVRAPDSYVYPAPANLVETFLIAPFELVLSRNAYAKLNRVALSILFFIPLTIISLYESVVRSKQNHWINSWFRFNDTSDFDTPQNRDPETSDVEGLHISKVKFDELTKHFPNVQLSSEAVLQQELRDVRAQLDKVLQRLDALTPVQGKSKKKSKKSGSSSSSSSD